MEKAYVCNVWEQAMKKNIFNMIQLLYTTDWCIYNDSFLLIFIANEP